MFKNLDIDKLIKGIFDNAKDISNVDKILANIVSGNQTIKFGIDPTGSELHLGHLFIIRKLQILQQLGNKIVIIIGDFTASIGDPSGRDSTRPFYLKKLL